MQIGKTIKAIRRKRNITQCEFSKQLGMTQSYMSLVENGLKNPSDNMIKKVSDIFDIPTPVLVWYAICDEDVKENLRKDFNFIKPIIDKMINDTFDK